MLSGNHIRSCLGLNFIDFVLVNEDSKACYRHKAAKCQSTCMDCDTACRSRRIAEFCRSHKDKGPAGSCVACRYSNDLQSLCTLDMIVSMA